MSKYYGKIGFCETKETSPGVYKDVIVEREYYGEVYRISRNWQKSENLNDDFSINNEFSIVADPYFLDAFHAIKYIEWCGTLWKVTGATVEYPRIRINIGGVYNGKTA